MRPGITGWAQVNGRNTINWQQKFEYDVWYVEHLSFKLDVQIIIRTIIDINIIRIINQLKETLIICIKIILGIIKIRKAKK